MVECVNCFSEFRSECVTRSDTFKQHDLPITPLVNFNPAGTINVIVVLAVDQNEDEIDASPGSSDALDQLILDYIRNQTAVVETLLHTRSHSYACFCTMNSHFAILCFLMQITKRRQIT